MLRSCFGAAAAAALIALPGTASAQDGRHVALMAGRSEYDLSGVERSNLYAVRAALPLRENVRAEGSLSYVHTRQQFGRTDLWIPEVQVHLYGVFGRFSPHLGLGMGMAIDAPEDAPGLETEVDSAPSASVGTGFAITDRVGVRVEGRVHGVELDFAGTVSELTAGIAIEW